MNRFYESGTEADLHFGSELAKRTPSSELRASSGAELRPADSFAIEPVATRYRRTTAERLFVRRRRRGAVSGLTRTCRPPQGDGGERHALARDHAVQPAAERGNPPRAGACEGLAMSLARIAGLRAAKLRPAALTCDFCATRSRAEGPATSGREKQPSARSGWGCHCCAMTDTPQFANRRTSKRRETALRQRAAAGCRPLMRSNRPIRRRRQEAVRAARREIAVQPHGAAANGTHLRATFGQQLAKRPRA